MSATVRIRSRAATLWPDVTIGDVAAIDVTEVRELWRSLGGPGSRSARLLTDPGHSPKGAKSARPQWILHLAPHRLADVGNVCPWSTRGCRRHCLYSAGRGITAPVQRGRIARTRLLAEHPAGFLRLLQLELLSVARRYPDAWVRLNGTSDIAWERSPAARHILLQSFLTFGDYTKATADQRPGPDLPNYRLARSVWPDRQTAADVVDLWRSGQSVSVVVDDIDPLIGHPAVADGDLSDEWLLRCEPTIGALSAKGSLKGDPGQTYNGHELANLLKENN